MNDSELEEYIQELRIYPLMQQLLQELIIHRPNEPLEFLVKCIKNLSDKRLSAIIVGANKTEVAKYCKTISIKYNAVFLSVPELVREYARKENELGKLCKKYVRETSIPEEIATAVISAKISEDECKQKGWILENYPTEKNGAVGLQIAGVLPEKFILLDCKNPDPDMINFNKYVGRLVDCYKDCVRSFDSSKPPGEVLRKICEFLDEPVSAFIGSTQRVFLVGTSQKLLKEIVESSDFDPQLIRLSCGDLLRDEVQSDTELGREIKKYVFIKHAKVPDNLVLSVIENRLQRADCRRRGWVLWGFPRTRDQAESLKSFDPTKIIIIQNAADHQDVKVEVETIDIFGPGVLHTQKYPSN